MRKIAPITEELATAYSHVRLAALLDSPSAFGSTYARESLLTREEWLRRCTSFDGETRIGFIAMATGGACGLVACSLDELDPSRADVISMWVAPSHRRTGLSFSLLDAVRSWAISRHVSTLQLMVTSSNSTVITFYQSYGFVQTGRTEPYPNDPALLELEMVRSTIS